MTLRDVGTWFEEVWASVADGYLVASTQSFWDWPLWISIPLVIGVPWFLFWVHATDVREMNGKVVSFWGLVGFAIFAVLAGAASYGAWAEIRFFDDLEPILPIMRLVYPIMTVIGCMGFAEGVFSRLKNRNSGTGDPK